MGRDVAGADTRRIWRVFEAQWELFLRGANIIVVAIFGAHILGNSHQAVLQSIAHPGQDTGDALPHALFGGFGERVENRLRMLSQRGGGREQPGVGSVLEARLVLLD
jgi:hypothetical protein